MDKVLVKYTDVSIKYGKYEAVKNASFEVLKGDFLNIIGPNGAGKTTLIKSLIHEINLSSGKIEMFTEHMGYVPQKLMLKRNFPITVLEFIYTGYPNPKFRIPKHAIEEIKVYLNKMDLEENILNQKINSLSGGELQRIYLIRSLISNPEILILDEPASALDPSFREKFYHILHDIKKEKDMTILHITHDLTDVVLDHSKVMYVDQTIQFIGKYEDYKAFEHEGHHHG
ncbi:metal ABC transporter ATP-binding protein [Acholeplasma hippikon]|uniref:ABC transporter ATP binding protein n=1 Tax=Acholeplasma hippikon TaxID=264636 RepID=A0A449BLE8_9MOLU|nr:metal ABC transporter ATP-binding protein [Acholeplasma hippikon]VEU83259.1 ABC transporter ATP binding protein [Acholeplasma hippikon]